MEIEEAIELFAGYIAFCEEYHQEVDLRADKIALQTMEEKSMQSQNPPLTLEELRGMDREPVWIVEMPDWGHWELSENAEDYFDSRDVDFYGMSMPPSLPDPMGRYGLHMMGWLAYRHKPEEEAT